MGQIMLWKVIREHEGDRKYVEGETREGTESDLSHLVPKVLELVGPKLVDKPAGKGSDADLAATAKSEPASEKDKAERASPANKADKSSRRKTRR